MGRSTFYLFSLFSLLIPAHLAPDPTLDTHWQLWVKSHQKSYKDAEEEHARRTIWEETLKFITVHNLEYSLGLHTYDVGMNHLGDMTGEEVAAKMTGYAGSDYSLANMTHVPNELFEAAPPTSIDWRTQNCVTPVRDQGTCGCCYAMSAVGAMECQLKKKMNMLFTLSPQELVDCSDTEGNNGCKSGNELSAFTYMMKHGVMQESAYMYTGQEADCNRKAHTGLKVTLINVVPADELMLKNAVGTVGPVSVSIDSSRKSFRLYKSGVYYDRFCTKNLDHSVLVVGYGTDIQNDYWLVKNSWGVGFGDQGYIRMARNKNNLCGIAQQALYPTV
ncbi:cathepsin S [Xenopus laevis]|uniref:Uncharacterized protein n=2 Tax=Xenopus laevis TaxID=8355 RepID=A0A974C9X4_XENLA|nr:cathepsin S [Xenopus laevis]OCT69284.1 hypothetical protein XELAEV_18040595mg [Xenopus laevis]